MIIQTIHDRMVKGHPYDENEREYLWGYAYEFGIQELDEAFENLDNEAVQQFLCRCVDAANPKLAKEYKEFINTHDWINAEE